MTRRIVPKDRKQYIDPKTGEIVNTIALIPEARDKNFVKVFKLMTTRVVKDLKAGIDGAVYTLFWLIDKVQEMQPNQDPIVITDPETIAKDLGMSKRTIYRHLITLKKYGYIKQIKKNRHIYRVEPTMIYKGTLQKYFDKESTERRRKERKEREDVEEVEQAPCISPNELSRETEKIENEAEASVFSGLIYLDEPEEEEESEGKQEKRQKKSGKQGETVLILE